MILITKNFLDFIIYVNSNIRFYQFLLFFCIKLKNDR